MARRNHEHWLRETGGSVAVRRQTAPDATASPQDSLAFALWLTADSMRRAGDLSHARATCPTYREEGSRAAQALGLPLASAAFSLSEGTLERRFFDMFEDLCRELRET